MEYQLTNLKERPDLIEKQDALCASVWPEFMLHDSTANTYWARFLRYFPEYQLLLLSGETILAVANSLPLAITSLDGLPEEGWDWGVAKAVEDFENGISGNWLLGIQIVVNPKCQGQGISTLVVSEMRRLCTSKNMQGLIIPVRPSIKSRYPLLSIEEYITIKNTEGLPFDPWLRVHIRAGGRILRPCRRAMHITGTVSDWEAWTGMAFPVSGTYTVPGALEPIRIDRENDLGEYTEPNVWILHQ